MYKETFKHPNVVSSNKLELSQSAAYPHTAPCTSPAFNKGQRLRTFANVRQQSVYFRLLAVNICNQSQMDFEMVRELTKTADKC